jgi:outer membrane protein OmpU
MFIIITIKGEQMNNLKKIGLTAIAASLATVSAHAGTLSVSGAASMSYTSNAIVGIGGGANGNPWAMSDTVNFAGSGEMDNGWTVDFTMGLDGSKTAVGAAFEDRTLKIGMGDLGTLTLMGQDGSSVVGAMDDKMPSAYEESWNFSGGPGTGTTVGSNAFKYANSSIDGLTLEASYVPATATAANGSTDIGLTYTGVEGLTIGIATGEDETAGSAATVDETAMYVTYAFDAFTVGMQANESDSAVAGADSEFMAYAISYAVNDDMSISFGHSEVDREGTSTATDATTTNNAISASYTMGSMTLAGTRASTDDAQGHESRDGDAYAVELSFAF